jgi:hypothetical protein
MNASNDKNIIKYSYLDFVFRAVVVGCFIVAVVMVWRNTRSYDDRKEAVIVFFDKVECRQRNFALLPAGADPIDIPVCGEVGKVKGLWN